MVARQNAQARSDVDLWNRYPNFIAAGGLDVSAPELYDFPARVLVSMPDHGSRHRDHPRLIVDDLVRASRPGQAMEFAGARPRRSQTGSRRTVSFCPPSDLQRHARNDRCRRPGVESLDRILNLARAFWNRNGDSRARRRKIVAGTIRRRV